MTWPFDMFDSGTPGINPNPDYGLDGSTDYRRTLGYDPKAAMWAQISRAFMESGARLASAPRGQAVGQGLLGFIEGSDAGKEDYENGLLNEYRWKQLAKQQAQGDAQAAYYSQILRSTRNSPSIPRPAKNGIGDITSPYLTSGGQTRPGGSPAGATPRLPMTPTASASDPFADLPDNVWRAAAEAVRMGDYEAARSIITNYRPKGQASLQPSAGSALTEDEIDRMPSAQFVQIDPSQLTPEQQRAVSRRLFREGR